MFDESLLESSKSHSPQSRRRRWLVIVATLMEAALVAALTLGSLLSVAALPALEKTNSTVSWAPLGAARPAAPPSHNDRPVLRSAHSIEIPTRIPTFIPTAHRAATARLFGTRQPFEGISLSAAGPGENPGGSGFLPGMSLPMLPAPKPALPHRVRVLKGIEAARIVFEPLPQYPPIAKAARIHGTVRLEAVIGTDGTVKQLRFLDGNPIFARAALRAVSQWRYQPTKLNGQPVEVETEIDVRFVLGE